MAFHFNKLADCPETHPGKYVTLYCVDERLLSLFQAFPLGQQSPEPAPLESEQLVYKIPFTASYSTEDGLQGIDSTLNRPIIAIATSLTVFFHPS